MKKKVFIVLLSVMLVVTLIQIDVLASTDAGVYKPYSDIKIKSLAKTLVDVKLMREAKSEIHIVNRIKLCNIISDDLKCMDDNFIPLNSVFKVSIAAGGLIYHLKNGAYKKSSRVMVRHHDNGDVSFYIKEGSLEDNLLIRKDGKIFLDGKEVEISNEIIDKNIEQETMLRQGWSSSFSNKPFKRTKSSDYKTKIKTIKNSNVNAHKTLKAITDVGLGSIIGNALSSVIRNLPAGFIASGFVAIARNLKNAAERYAPNSAYFSYKCPVYRCDRKSNGVEKLYEYCASYYVKKNYKGHKEKKKFYEYRYWN